MDILFSRNALSSRSTAATVVDDRRQGRRGVQKTDQPRDLGRGRHGARDVDSVEAGFHQRFGFRDLGRADADGPDLDLPSRQSGAFVGLGVGAERLAGAGDDVLHLPEVPLEDFHVQHQAGSIEIMEITDRGFHAVSFRAIVVSPPS